MSDSISSKDIQQLVKELSKVNPDAKVIKGKTEILGIPYSNDLIVLMSEVLVYLSKNNTKSRLREKSV